MDAAEPRFTGLSLIIGRIVSLVAGLITPGRLLIEPVEALDLVGLNETLTNYPSLTHISTVLTLFGLSLLLFGVLKFPKMAQGLGGTTRNLLLLGVSMVVFFLVCRLLARGTYHAVAHVLEHGVGGGGEQLFNILALSLQMMRVSLRYVGGTLGLVGFALFAWCATGLFSSRFHVVVGKIMAIYSAVGFVALMLSEHIHGFDFGLLTGIYTSLRVVVLVWLLTLGFSIYQD